MARTQSLVSDNDGVTASVRWTDEAWVVVAQCPGDILRCVDLVDRATRSEPPA